MEKTLLEDYIQKVNQKQEIQTKKEKLQYQLEQLERRQYALDKELILPVKLGDFFNELSKFTNVPVEDMDISLTLEVINTKDSKPASVLQLLQYLNYLNLDISSGSHVSKEGAPIFQYRNIPIKINPYEITKAEKPFISHIDRPYTYSAFSTTELNLIDIDNIVGKVEPKTILQKDNVYGGTFYHYPAALFTEAILNAAEKNKEARTQTKGPRKSLSL